MKLSIFRNILLFIVLIAHPINSYAKEQVSDINYDYNYSSLSGKCPTYDPYEKFNRKIYFFNGVLDTIIVRPITKGYGAITNDYTKSRVNSIVSNTKEPLSTVNYIAQGKGEKFHKSFWRFFVNSTFGVLGLFDVASKVGLPAESQTFGSTLAHYGVGPGPYIVLPLFGGTSARDITDNLFTNTNLNILNYYMPNSVNWGLTIATVVSFRDQVMPFTDYVTQNSPDSYIAIRDATLSQKEAKVQYPVNFRCPSHN